MHPYLIDITLFGTAIRIPSYGVCLALAFSIAYFEALRRAIQQDEDPRHVENLFLIIVLSALVGARAFHVLFEEFAFYREHPNKIFAVWEGGYTFYGAFLMAFLGLFFYCRAKKLSMLQTADICAPSTMIGLCIGRIGCFLAGCCWGKQCDLPWAVRYTDPNSFSGVKNIPLHPTQLYESFGALCVALYCFWLFRRRTYRGQILFHMLIGYAALRSLVERFRGDEYRGYILGGWLSYAQFISLVLALVSVAGIIHFRKKERLVSAR